MKLALVFRNVLKHTFYVLLLCCTSLSVFAQCPTIASQNPPAICPGAGLTFDDLTKPPYNFVTGPGILWYDAPTGGNLILNTLLATEGTYYIDNDLGTCATREFINIDFVVDPSGFSLDKIYCTNEDATYQTYIDDVLQSIIPIGGTVEVYTDFNLTNLVDPNATIPGRLDLYVVFVDNGGCQSQIEIAKINLDPAPQDPTPPLMQTFCADTNPTVANLARGTLATNYSWYQSLDGFGNPDISTLLSSSEPLTNDIYYIQIDDILCDSRPIGVTVTIDIPLDAGLPGTLEYCEDNIPAGNFNLFDELTGTPDVGGEWTGPLATTNNHLGTLDRSNLSAGTHVFTYSINNAPGACDPSTSTVTITISAIMSSGTPVVSNPYCESQLPASFDLFTLLSGHDLGGLWTQGTTSSDPVVPNPTAIDLTGLTAAGSPYSFTYTQNFLNPCPDESTTVQVVVLADPNAGTAINASFCENDIAANSPYDLFNALDATQDHNSGTWTDGTNTTVPDPLNLDITGFTVAGSPYTFNYTIDNGSCSDTEAITITIQPAPESGTPIVSFPEYCIAEITTGQTVDLFDLLTGEDQNGTWNDDDASGELTLTSIVNIDNLPEGTYNFTYDVPVTGTCDDPNVTVSIIINDPLAPTAVAIQEFCDIPTVANLVAAGTTIQWYDNATGGTPLDGATALTHGGTYYATQTDATTGCESSVRTLVTATIYVTPNSGALSTTPITACNDNNSIDLFTGLDGFEDAGGVWQDTDGTGTLTANIFNATGFAAGTYQFTYLVTASAPCVDRSTVITVTIEEPLSAGTSNGDPTFCSSDSTFDLNSNLTGASPGGEWTFNSAPVTNQFDPSNGQSGTYTYTTFNTCGSSSESFDVTVIQAPNAGTSNPALICVIDGPTDLFTFLGGADTLGTWSPVLASGTGVFDPLVDTDGVYRYTVTANSPCTVNAFAEITVTVSDIVPPVVNNATMEFCLVNNPTVADLDSALTVTGTITWYEDAALTTALNATDTLVDGEDYHATQRNASGCESSISVQVDVIVNDTPTPTIRDSSVEYCINDGPTINDLSLNITEYDSSTDNIVWYDTATGGSTISSSSLLNHDITYYAVLVDAITGCESSVRLPLTTDLRSCGKLILPDGFSPNGDGTNDTYDFDNLHILYPDFVIEIFNRYGSIVYKGNANTPRFNGTSNQSRTIGSGDLSVGVYYYIFNFNDGENKPEQGRLYLSR